MPNINIQHVPYVPGIAWAVGESVIASTTISVTTTNSKGVPQLTGDKLDVQAFGATPEDATANLIAQLNHLTRNHNASNQALK